MLKRCDVNIFSAGCDYALDNHVKCNRRGRGKDDLLCRAMEQVTNELPGLVDQVPGGQSFPIATPSGTTAAPAIKLVHCGVDTFRLWECGCRIVKVSHLAPL